jgi:fructokinase
MPARKFTVVGLGELLWDLFSSGKQLGGAPGNFAYISNLLGDRGIVASRIGTGPLGDEAIQKLTELGLSASDLQRDAQHPTGSVKVHLDGLGQPQFEITESVAWDFLEWTPQWQELAAQTDAVCFGSLAQRSRRSRETIQHFLKAVRPGTVRIFDANLRQAFFTPEVVRESIGLAEVVKLNHEEVPRVMQLLGLQHASLAASVQRLCEEYGLKLVCVTRGEAGSLLADESSCDEHPGFRVNVADTVGSGDAFTAGLVHHYLRHGSLAEMNDAANRLGAWVASNVGAMPVPDAEGLEKALAKIG